MRCSGCIVNNDDSDDSVNSLFSFVDDHYDTGESLEQILSDTTPITPQANRPRMFSPVRSSTRSMYSLNASGNTPSLITPHDGQQNRSLSAYLFHIENDAASTSNYSCSSSSSSKKIRKSNRTTKVTTDSLSNLETSNNSISTGSSIRKKNATRKPTKMSMFNLSDLSGLDVLDDAQSCASIEAKNTHNGSDSDSDIMIKHEDSLSKNQ